jgi:MFS family permease
VEVMQQGEKMSLFVICVAASAATAGLLYGYDVGVINAALVFLRRDFQLGSVATELLVTVLLWGCAAGAALAGWVSDRYGRRAVLFGAGILFCAAAFGAASSAHLWQLLAARVLAGVAVGSALLIAPLYIAEIAPAHARGRLVTVNQLAVVAGILIGFMINYELARIAHNNWRWMFGVGALPAFALCASLLWIPESPRWLLQHGQRERASAVSRQISSGTGGEEELNEIARAIQEETGTYRELLGPALRKPLVIAIMLAEHADASASQAIGMNVLVGVVNLLFTIIGLLLIDRLGRRPLLLTATGGMGLCLLVFAGMLHYLSGRSTLLLVPVLGYVSCFAFGLGTAVWVCLAELFPNRIRGRAMSIATMVLWITVSFVTATFLSLIKIFTASGVFLGYALLCTASFVYIFLCLPETKNRTLEEIESIWSKEENR